jgi:radical SAM protein with 4Fe4S-binding SPASM domain
VARGLVRLGVREVGLIGGEVYLRPDSLEIISLLSKQGVRVGIQTGGRALTLERARALRDAGLTQVGVSIDGTARVHDRLRGNLGSHAAAMRALENAAAVGLEVTSNTQINRLNMDQLRDIAREIQAKGVFSWMVQLTVPMGRAADHPEWIVEPWHVVAIVDTLAAIQRDAAERATNGRCFDVVAGNNIGYFGPHEELLRSRPGSGKAHWSGCAAGVATLGIESDGTLKACPSLPTAPYAAGNVRDASLESLWRAPGVIQFTRERTVDELWGFCKTCYYADECRAGCSWTVHTTLGKRGNNPFCYHRVKELEKRGERECLVSIRRAPGTPYDFGQFELRTEKKSTDPAASPPA